MSIDPDIREALAARAKPTSSDGLSVIYYDNNTVEITPYASHPYPRSQPIGWTVARRQRADMIARALLSAEPGTLVVTTAGATRIYRRNEPAGEVV